MAHTQTIRHLPAFLIVIELRNSSPAGLVVETLLGRAASRVFLRYRSIVAALIRPGSRSAYPSQSASSPCVRSVGIHRGSIALRCFAHGRSIISHTWTSSSRDCCEYRFGRSAGAGGLPRPASVSLRLAVLLPIVNTEHISSRMRPLSFFDAFMYSSLNLRVICCFVAMLILSSIRQAKQDRYRSRSFPMRHRYALRAQKKNVRRVGSPPL